MKLLPSHLESRSLILVGGLAVVSSAFAVTPVAADLGANQLLDGGVPVALSQMGRAVASGDFNGDGYDDLAIGLPFQDVGPHDDAGRVVVYYGRAGGFLNDPTLILDQDLLGDCGSSASEEGLFGSALAAGDFDNDTFDDLVIGAPFDDDSATNAGRVHVLIGGAGGLVCCHSVCVAQSNPDILDNAEIGDGFGEALETGDFNGDGYDDLVVGVPGEDIGNKQDAGAANVVYGSATGLTATGDQFWHQDVAGTQGGAEMGDEFAAALAAGDFDDDGNDDLAIGIPSEDLGTQIPDTGSVHVLRGSGPSGLVATGDQIWSQNTAGVLDASEWGDALGSSLVAADFNDDGRDDLAIGVPFEAVGAVDDAGAVNLLLGSAAGLTADDDQFWHQAIPGTAGGAEEGDGFGWALAAGDFDSSGSPDLVVGIPYEDLGTQVLSAGAVHVLRGGAAGLRTGGNRIWHQDQPGVADQAEPADNFGWALTTGDFDGNGTVDLAVGVRLEKLAGESAAGAVHVFYGHFGIFGDGFESGDTSAWSAVVP